MATVLIETGSIDIEAIKEQYPLASVVEQHVVLKRRSGVMEGLCPFHSERTPSFKIYENDQRYHCFGCGAHGDIFDFLRELEGLDLRTAAERITGGRTLPPLTAERIEELRLKRARFEEEERQRRFKATAQATERWLAADPNFLDHPYLERKGIQPHGTRLDGDKLLVPLIGEDNKIQTLQSIDPDGRKLFVSAAPMAGGLFVVGGKVATSERVVILCEGFATAASIHEATGCVTVCAFNAGNMVAVAERLKTRYPTKEYIVAGDDDRGKDKNVGKTAAIAAAEILGCRAVLPALPGDEGTDFNDMAAVYGGEAVRALVLDGELPDGGRAEEVAPDPEPGKATFPLLSLDELEALPPPTYIIDDLLTEAGFAVIYGDPGSLKTFIALDMGLRLSYGMEWHGKAVRQVGVLYIAGEGHAGLGKRVKGWRREHGLEGEDAPFLLLPEAVQMLENGEVDKLLRTISAAILKRKISIGLSIVDTVSRSLTGADENSQDAMSKFVHSCTLIQRHTGGAVLGIHHTGKDASRGMRGSTVLIGACDTSIKCEGDMEVTKSVTLTVEKQKDGEQIGPVTLAMKEVEWNAGLLKPVTTLVPHIAATTPSSDAPPSLSNRQRVAILEDVNRRFDALAPYTNAKNMTAQGRYLPRIVAARYDLSFNDAQKTIQEWIDRGILVAEIYEKRNGKTGLRAPTIPSDWLRG